MGGFGRVRAIDPYTNNPETMTFNNCCFAIGTMTAHHGRA